MRCSRVATSLLSAATVATLLLLAAVWPASALLVMPRRSNGTLLTLRLDSDSNEIDSGTTAYRFPRPADWELVAPSDAFFLANRAELVTSRRLTADRDAGRTHELLAVNGASDEVARLKISVGARGDGPRFAEGRLEVAVPENAPAGTEIARLDKDLIMRNGERADSFRIERTNRLVGEDGEPVRLETDGSLLRIVTLSPIDFETAPKKGSFDYRLIASDSERRQGRHSMARNWSTVFMVCNLMHQFEHIEAKLIF